MFGGDWEDAEATIVDRRLIREVHGGEGGILSRQVFEYIADVRPDSGTSAFRATVQEPSKSALFGLVSYQGLFASPQVGQQVRVKFRAKDQHVEFDTSDPGTRRDGSHKRSDEQAVADAHSPEARASWEALATASPGSSSSSSPTPSGTHENALVQGLSLGEILATGVPARVVVVESEMWSPPTTDKAGHPVYRFLLTVIQDGVDPFRYEEAQGMPPSALPLIYPGANLPAKVATGGQVAIDWDAA